MAQWLIRTAPNAGLSEVQGPMDIETLKEVIRSGNLQAKDEICSGDGYWFSIEDADEMERQVGIVPPREALKSASADSDAPDDETQTDTELLTEPPIPDLPDVADAAEPSATRVMRSKSRVHLAGIPQRLGRVQVIRSMERPSVWKILGFILAGVVLGLLILTLKILA
jgi:hypothetical protein